VITALLDSDAVLELVVDNVHVHPALVNWVMRRAAPGRVALITDAMVAAGMGDGDYVLGSLAVQVRDGVARLAGGDSIAGSTLTLDVALRNAVEAGVGLADAVTALTAVPARMLGVDAGVLDAGRPADLIVLSDFLAVEAVMAHGEWIVQLSAV
jgi:N-acetylglucosamine-6-phosphate deacetylase